MAAPAFVRSTESASPSWAVALLALVALALFLPGFAGLPPMDRDEPRFAQASKQMLETGDVVSIRYQDEARNKKPVGIYWMQAAAVAAGEALGVDDARRQIWLYRLPSLFGAIAVVLGTYWTALAFTSSRTAFTGALLMASTVLLDVEAHLAKTDAVLCATVVFAMGSLSRIYLSARRCPDRTPIAGGGLAVPAVFWSAMAIGILVKGPITPMVAAFAIVVLCIKDRSGAWLRGLKPLLGLVLVAVSVLPWFVLILLRTKGAFLADSVGHDMLGKVGGVQEAHGAPPGTYLAAFWATAWPMTPFVALAAPGAWRRRGEPAIAFLLAWILPTWFLFEAVPTKLPHYVLPVYPALAILAATILLGGNEARRPRPLGQAVLTVALLNVMPIAIGVALFGTGQLLWTRIAPAMVAAGVATALIVLALAVWAARNLMRGDPEKAVLASTAAALLAYLFILGHLLAPDVSDRLALSARLAEAGRQALGPDCATGELAAAGDHEPSLVFLTGTQLLLTDGPGAAAFIQDRACRAAFVERRVEPDFMAAIPDPGTVTLVQRVAGTAINGAKSLDIGVYVRQRQRP